jgi:mevalonate kinase
MKVAAPGKLILSGEHAVVYGHPALAMAVNRYVTATATPQAAPHIAFDLSDFSYQRRVSLSTLESLKDRIKANYHRFVKGDFKIRDVLQKPVELAQVALSIFFEVLNIKLTQGVKIHVESTIPMGCGMGSSAATVLSVVHAVAKHLDMNLTPEMFLRLGREAENMQHGYSSGLDLQVSLYGGCHYLEAGQLQSRNIPSLPLYLVNTGSPSSTTGECVESAARYFRLSHIGAEFAAVTTAMDAAFQANHVANVQAAVRENQALLTTIGVVPQTVQQFIAAVEALGGAAKVCGAGAVTGEQAGVALVVTEDEAALRALCDRLQYSLLPIVGEARGVHLI